MRRRARGTYSRVSSDDGRLAARNRQYQNLARGRRIRRSTRIGRIRQAGNDLPSMNDIESLLKTARPLRDQVASHGVYRSLATLEKVHIFMENHVFAVWDFMSLVKSLQSCLTSVSVPWLATEDPLSRRFINEIVLDEESDDDGQGGYLSHFELYLQAMRQCGADTSRIMSFIEMVGLGETVPRALVRSEAPRSARAFVENTWTILESRSPHRIAAAFTIGREEIVPEMFQAMIGDIRRRFPERLARFGYYLERHINVDKERHAPMAARMLERLCGDDSRRWQEATDAAQTALRARIALWDCVQARIASSDQRLVSPTPSF